MPEATLSLTLVVILQAKKAKGNEPQFCLPVIWRIPQSSGDAETTELHWQVSVTRTQQEPGSHSALIFFL